MFETSFHNNFKKAAVSIAPLPQSLISAATAFENVVMHEEIEFGVNTLHSATAVAMAVSNPSVSIMHGIDDGRYENAFIPATMPIATEITSVTTAGMASGACWLKVPDKAKTIKNTDVEYFMVC